MKPYHYRTIQLILERKKDLSSGIVWKHLNDTGTKISRASVINYLKTLHAEGVITGHAKTGKGGVHMVYSKKLNFEEILTHIVTQVMDTLLGAFPESDYVKYIIEREKAE